MEKHIRQLGLVASTALLGGCFIFIEEPPYRSYDMWFEDATVYCEYNVEEQISSWTLVTNVDTSYGPGQIEDVYATIDGSYLYTFVNTFHLRPVGEDEWRVSFDNVGTTSDSYHCLNTYDFLFTAYDFEGHYVSTWERW